jgi:F420-dependent oxidoreductase-like protein
VPGERTAEVGLPAMRIGIFLGEGDGTNPLDHLVAGTRKAATDGFPSVWIPHIFGLDALIALAVMGREVPDVEVGSAVIPTYPRHPILMAQQALTTQLATGGRLALGIGLSHQVVVEGMYGYSFERPARHMREYLAVLLPLLRQEGVAFEGETVRAQGAITVPGVSPPPVLLAALGPRMLHLAGAMAAGTITWMTGPRALASHIVPAITRAAEQAVRPAPRVVAALPVCVTDDVEAARQQAARAFQLYGQLPSYRAMLDHEGVDGPADIAVIGDEASVRAQVEEVLAAGATDFVASEIGSEEQRARTRALLITLRRD